MMRLPWVLIFVELALVTVVAACTPGCRSNTRPVIQDVRLPGPVQMRTLWVELPSGSTGVDELPAWAVHARNGQFINEVVEHLPVSQPEGMKIDKGRIGLMGFSAGGLATLLAVADNPAVQVWVGLDPVDRNGMGAAAAACPVTPVAESVPVVSFTAWRAESRRCCRRDQIMSSNPEPHRRQIPLPGGSGCAPTGAVQFQDDWPCSFVATRPC